MSGERTKRFKQGREKLRLFKQRTGMTYAEIAARAGIKSTTAKWILGAVEPSATNDLQEAVDLIIKKFHINPRWVYDGDRKVMIDNQKLTPIEICHTGIDTENKRKSCYKRFNESRKRENVSIKEFSRIADVYPSIVDEWIKNNTITKKCIKAMLDYCDVYNVNPIWIFFGINEKFKREIDTGKKKSKPKQDWWYVVNYSEIRYDSWLLIPEKYKIKLACTAAEIARNYTSGKETIKRKDGEYIDNVLAYERAIGKYKTKNQAMAALAEEMERIKEYGNNAWIEPWANEVIT